MEASPASPLESTTSRVLKVLRRGALYIVAAAVLGVAAGWGVSAIQTPAFRAEVTLYVTSGSEDSTSSAYQGSLASQQRASSYASLARTDAVLGPALARSGLNIGIDDARRDISASASPDSVLIYLEATSGSRGEAATLADAVSRSLTEYVARLETPAGSNDPLARVTVVSTSRSDAQQIAPRETRNLVVGGLAAAILAAAAVVGFGLFSERIRYEEDLKALGLAPVLAAIPVDDAVSTKALVDFGAGGTGAAEAYRKLRTNLAFANVDNPPRSIVVTSAVAVEGKTTTAMNLSTALVEAGKRVALVDADLRRPQVNARMGLMGEIGLTNFLRGDGSLNELVQPTPIEGLWVLAAGSKPPNPAELLASNRTKEAVSELLASFDYVVIDSPPVLPVTDAVVLSQWADGVLLVARSGNSRLGDLASAFEQVSSSKTPVLGFVLTEAPLDKMRYGYYSISPKQKKTFFGRNRQPQAVEQVREPKISSSKH